MDTTAYILCTPHEPGIQFDEVQVHRVCSRGQLKRLRDLVIPTRRAVTLVTAADVANIAASGDCAACPTLYIVAVLEFGNIDYCVGD